MPARHCLHSKRNAHGHEIMRSNSRLQKRRASLRSLNILVGALDLTLATVDPRHVDGVVRTKIL